jgi:SAM-dependent methyltransferase
MTAAAASSVLPPLAPRAWLRYDVVDRLVAELRPATVLEIGCGQGSMGARLARRADYLAVEPDPDSYAVARARVAACGGTVLNADHTAVPAGATYDLVCAFEVLEHLADDAGALADWVRFVAPGGHLMLSVPAFQDRFGPMDTRVGHYRRYEPRGLAGLLTAAGLTDPDVRVYGWPLGYALEAVRNRMDAKHLATEAAAAAAAGPSPEERTAASGRHQQPARPAVGRAIEAATLPFRYLQRLAPVRGTGLVAVATRRA